MFALFNVEVGEDEIRYFYPKENTLTDVIRKNGHRARWTVELHHAKLWSKYLPNKC